MLSTLTVSDVVLIERLELRLSRGFTAITGETGAGKSILLDALALALGARADKSKVRTGAARALVSAAFDPPMDHPVRAIVEDAGLGEDRDEPLVLRRALGEDGRSRAYVNDEPTGVSLLKRLGDALIEVHGQHDGRGLLDPRTHRGALDAFGGLGDERAATAEAWAALSQARAACADLEAAAARLAENRADLTEALESLRALAPQEGEASVLSAERRFLQGAESTLTGLTVASEALEGEGGVQDRLAPALRGLEAAVDALGLSAREGDGREDDHKPAGAGASLVVKAADALERALIEAQEAADAVRAARNAFDADPGRLEALEERLFALRAAGRKHAVDADALPSVLARLEASLALLQGEDAQAENARAARVACEERYHAAADRLSAARHDAARRLNAAVAGELAPLRLGAARFQAEVDTAPDREGPQGRDRVRFLVATNPGAALGPLDAIASGGELSRFALALKVALAEDGGAHVFVFDEVDQGVGGATAAAIGARLAALGRGAQVLVVTHSPQVAAAADHHLKIEKVLTNQGEARTRVLSLEAEARVEELARMLSGDAVTREARAAGIALLQEARNAGSAGA